MIFTRIRTASLAMMAAMAFTMPALAAAPTWTVDPATSQLGFSATQSGAPFSGSFRKWDGAIAFDPADLAHSSVKITIDIASVTTGDADRDGNLPTGGWFDVAGHPTAVFEATSFTHTGGNTYTAAGTLTLKGISKPVNLAFQLDITGKDAKAEGTATLDRTAFDVGTGQWAGEDVAGHQVQVKFTINAKTS